MSGTDNERLLEKKPTISAELVDWLDKNFPIVSPSLDDTERQIFYCVGQRSVVDHLHSLFKEQNDHLLE